MRPVISQDMHKAYVREFTEVLTRLVAVLRPRALPHLTTHQVNLLNELDTRAPVFPSYLADRLGVKRPAISEAVGRLVALGLVEKRRSPLNKSFIELRCTAEGDRQRRLPSAVDVGRVREVVRWLGTFYPYGIRRMLELLLQIVAATETVLEKAPEPECYEPLPEGDRAIDRGPKNASLEAEARELARGARPG